MSAKVKDDKNRWRNKTVAFRMSPEEAEELDKRWRLLGYRNKQDYLIDAVLHNEVHAVGNAQMLFQFRSILRDILAELQRLQKAGDMRPEMQDELAAPLRTMNEILSAFQEKAKKKKAEEKMSKPQFERMTHLQKLKTLMEANGSDPNAGQTSAGEEKNG